MKALTDEQIKEVCRRYAAGETMRALGKEYHVSDTTIANYIHGNTRANSNQGVNPLPPQNSEPAPPEPTEEPQPETADLYEVARGFEIFVKKHTEGDFSISVSRSNGVTVITAAAGNEEITIWRKHSAVNTARCAE